MGSASSWIGFSSVQLNYTFSPFFFKSRSVFPSARRFVPGCNVFRYAALAAVLITRRSCFLFLAVTLNSSDTHANTSAEKHDFPSKVTDRRRDHSTVADSLPPLLRHLPIFHKFPRPLDSSGLCTSRREETKRRQFCQNFSFTKMPTLRSIIFRRPELN